MIERIVEIKNVGAFDDHRAAGNVQLKRLTLIAGGNSDGKTTLVAILRSLRDQSAAPLTERKTVGATGGQRVHLRVGAADVRFDGTAWTGTCGPIEVFDEDFIARNVHGEDGVDTDHRRGMYSVIIGEQGVNLRNRIVEFTEQIRLLGTHINEAAAALTPHLFGLPLAEFRRLSLVPEVDARIAEKERELAAAQQKQEVVNATLFESLMVPALDVAAIESALAASLAGLSTAAAARVATRISNRLGPQGQSWLAAGVQFGIDGDCPFCGLETVGNQLIQDYQGFFSQGYQSLRTGTQTLIDQITAQIGPGPVARVLAAVARNSAKLPFWLRFLTATLIPPDLAEFEAAAASLAETLLTLLRQKANAPLEAIHLSQTDRQAVDRLTRSLATLNTYNASVLTANAMVNQFRAGLAGMDANAIQQALSRLRAAKARHTPPVMALCDALSALEGQKTAAENTKVQARQQLDQYAEAIIQRYQTKINQYLAQFRASFRLSGLTENYAGGQPGCQYGIEVRQVNVPLAGGGTSVRFNTVLSGGDKRSLALALFFARLEECPNIADTRVVLDDPMCSLDRSRRFVTARRVLRLALEAKQVILLSHDPLFLRVIWDESRPTAVAASTATLMVEKPTTVANLIPWDIEEDTAPEFYKQLKKIDGYAGGGPGDPLDVKRTLRPLVETWLRHERPRAFGPTHWLGGMIEAIRDAPAGSNLEPLRAKLPDITDINAYTREDHHGANPGTAPDPIDAQELRGFVTRTLVLVGWN